MAAVGATFSWALAAPRATAERFLGALSTTAAGPPAAGPPGHRRARPKGSGGLRSGHAERGLRRSRSGRSRAGRSRRVDGAAIRPPGRGRGRAIEHPIRCLAEQAGAGDTRDENGDEGGARPAARHAGIWGGPRLAFVEDGEGFVVGQIGQTRERSGPVGQRLPFHLASDLKECARGQR